MIKVGIIGMGYGRQVHLPVFQNIPGIDVVALADGGSGKAQEISDLSDGHMVAYTDPYELISSKNVNLVSIATPPSTHYALVKACLKAGKDVLCEKPFGISLEQTEELLELEKNSTGKVCVGFEFPYDAAFLNLKKYVQNGDIGKIQRFKVQWLTSGGFKRSEEVTWKTSGEVGTGLLYDWCCHVFDYSLDILQSDIKWVWCKQHSTHEIDILCQFENEAIGQFVVGNTYKADLGHKIDILGQEGVLNFVHVPPYKNSNKYLTLNMLDKECAVDLPVLHAFDDMYPDNRMSAMHQMVSGFVQTDDAECFPSIKRAQKVWQLLASIKQSIETQSIAELG